MPLRTKILLALTLIAIIPLALFGGVAYATSTSSLANIEQDGLKSSLDSANHALADLQTNMSGNLIDDGNWDDLHNIAAQDVPDPVWIKDNFAPGTASSTFNTFGLNLLAIWNYQNKLTYNVGLADAMAIQINSAIKNAPLSKVPETMLMPSGADIYLLGLTAIRTSAGENPDGVLLFGRKLTASDTGEIADLVGSEVALYQGTQLVIGPRVQRPNPTMSDLAAVSAGNSYRFNQGRDDFAVAFTPIRGSDGQTIATLVIWRPRTAVQASQRVIITTLGLAFGIGAMLAILVSVLLGASIVSPLIRISSTADLIANGDLSQQIDVSRLAKDELARLASAFNGMTKQLSHSIDELNHRVREINQTNVALQAANAKAEELARVRGEFLATMSHELRTPLNAILGFSDVLLIGVSGPLNDGQRHQVERLKDNGKRLLALINDVLDMSRIEAGRIELASEPFALGSMIERIADQMRVLAEQKHIRFVTEVSPQMPPILIGDEKRLEQVVVNLLSNAFKFTEEGSVIFKVGMIPAENRWTITVKDTGIGIPPHALDMIFEPFRQVDGSSTRAYKGSGLGLAIAQQFIQSMDGQITVESELGRGSTFTITLPVKTPEAIETALVQAEGE